MSIQKKKIIDHLSPKSIKRNEEARTDRTLRDRNRSYSRDIQRHNFIDLTIGDNHKTDAYNMDVTVGEEVIDAKIMITKVTV